MIGELYEQALEITISPKVQEVRVSWQFYLLTLLVAYSQREIEVLVDLTKQG